MLHQGGLYDEWRKSITPKQAQIDSLPEGESHSVIHPLASALLMTIVLFQRF